MRAELKKLRHEIKPLRVEKEVLKKACAFFAKRNEVKFKFIKCNVQHYAVRTMCRVIRVGVSAYYDWIFKVVQSTREHMKQDVTNYMHYHNEDRLHTSSGDMSFVDFENSQLKVSDLR